MTKLLTYIFIFLFTFTSSVNAGYSDAINRGETGAGIFSLKNFGNENTNGMSKTEWMKENNLTIGSAGSLSLLNDYNSSQAGNAEGNTSIMGTAFAIGKVGLWAWSTYIAGKSAESIGSNVASWKNGPDENGLYMTEYGSKVSGNALLYSTSKNSLGLITSIGTAGGSNLISGLGFTSIGATGLMEDGFIYSQGKNSAGYYENLSGMYMTGTDLAIDSASNMISFGLGVYQVNKSINESINKTFDSGFIDFGDTLPKSTVDNIKSLPKTGTDFFVDSSGQVFPAPKNYISEPTYNQKGAVLKGSLSEKNIEMRIMDSVGSKNYGNIPAYPNGYVKYTLPESNAGLNPYTLKQIDTEMKGHFPIKKGE